MAMAWLESPKAMDADSPEILQLNIPAVSDNQSYLHMEQGCPNLQELRCLSNPFT